MTDTSAPTVVVTASWIQRGHLIAQAIDETGETVLLAGPPELLPGITASLRVNASVLVTLDERWQVIPRSWSPTA